MKTITKTVGKSKIQIELKRNLSKMQMHLLSKFDLADTIEYLKTIEGRGSFIGLDKPVDTSFDSLSDKLPNSILFKLNTQYNGMVNKTPLNINLGGWVGVEIECIIPGNYSFDFLNKKLLKNKIKNVSIHSDSSIRVEKGDACGECENCNEGDSESCEHIEKTETGVEFTVLFQLNNPSNLKKLTDMLKSLNAFVNTSCGLHVHLDCRDIVDNTRALNLRATRLVNALPVLINMVPSSRRHNTYCQYGKNKLNSRGRYYMINMTSFERHKTIEVRLHSGTTDYDKIINWANLLFLITREKKFNRTEAVSYSLFSETLTNADTKLMSYVKSRIAKFNPEFLTKSIPEIVIVDEMQKRQIEFMERANSESDLVINGGAWYNYVVASIDEIVYSEDEVA